MKTYLAVILLALCSCGTLRGAGKGLKEDSRLFPAPYDTIADIAGTALLLFAGHRTVRHIKKRRAAKAAKAITP